MEQAVGEGVNALSLEGKGASAESVHQQSTKKEDSQPRRCSDEDGH